MRSRLALLALGLSSLLACDGQTSPPPDPNAPPPKPMTLTLEDLQVSEPRDYPIEDGRTMKVTVTNFCEEQSDIGFSPDNGRPPIVWRIQPRQRQEITIPLGYDFRARLSHEDEWTARCPSGRNYHMIFSVDCQTCIASPDDPVELEDCVAAGACLPDEPTDSPTQ